MFDRNPMAHGESFSHVALTWCAALSLCLLVLSGCSEDKSDDDVPIDINYSARDAAGQGSSPTRPMNSDDSGVAQDAAAISLDLGTGGSAGMDTGADAGGMAGAVGQGGQAGMTGNPGLMDEIQPPQCPPNGDDCQEACRFLADCAVGGACTLDESDRPLIVNLCEQTCASNPIYGQLICGHDTCEDSLMLANNDAIFAAVCRGEAPPQMADPVVAQCTALNTCLGNCNGDRNCQTQCRNNSTPEANQRFSAITDCLIARECITPANEVDYDCLQAQCGRELERCFGPQILPEGEGSCNGLLRCFNGCEDGDDVCRQNCIRDTSPESYALYEAAIQCIREFCPNGADECQRENCGDTIDICVEDGRPTGASTCVEINNCFWRCGGLDPVPCRTACTDEGTREAQNLFSEFINCAAMQNCAGQVACQNVCPQEFNACENGAVPNPDMGMPEADAGMDGDDAGVGALDSGLDIVDEPIE